MNEDLLNRDIDIMFGGEVVNTFQFTQINPVGKQFFPFLGKSVETYNCDLKFEKIMEGADPSQLFYQEIFDDLRKKGVAICPQMPNLYYAFKGVEAEKKVNPAPTRKEEYKKINAKYIPEWHKRVDEAGLLAFMMLTINEKNEIQLCTADGLSKAEIVKRLRYLATMIEKNPVYKG